jgi:hypothetical protein
LTGTKKSAREGSQRAPSGLTPPPGTR